MVAVYLIFSKIGAKCERKAEVGVFVLLCIRKSPVLHL
jgi:hypothetical protein